MLEMSARRGARRAHDLLEIVSASEQGVICMCCVLDSNCFLMWFKNTMRTLIEVRWLSENCSQSPICEQLTLRLHTLP